MKNSLQIKNLKIWLNQYLLYIYLLWFLALGFVLVWSLTVNDFLPGQSLTELQTIQITSSWPSFLTNFIHWPYYLTVYLLSFLSSDSLLVARLTSILSSLLACGCLLFFLRRYFGVIVSLIGITVFAFNSWILQLSQSGSGEMMAIALFLALLMSLVLIKDNPQKILLQILCLFLIFLNWFNPLMPWMIVGLLIYVFYKYKFFARYLYRYFRFILGGLLLILVILMVLAAQENSKNILIIWGLDLNWNSVQSLFMNLWQTLIAVFWQSPLNPSRWLDSLPFLDIFLAAMISFGIYVVWRQKYQIEIKFLAIMFGGLFLLAGLNQGILTPGLFMMLPLIILLCIAGLNEWFDYWKKIFPLNPLAKFFGILIIVLLLNLSLFYQLRRYFVAWPQNSQTQQMYNFKQDAE